MDTQYSKRCFPGADLRDADLSCADLIDANLSCADLRSANLRDADLRSANLSCADLRSANLSCADLRSANLRSANLSCADLRDADLRDANLRDADLRSANLRSANLPPPTIVLLAYWGEVSNSLCIDLMRYDTWNHPDPNSFMEWVQFRRCPYRDAKIQRCANFEENPELYSPGPSKSAYELMVMVLREKTKDCDL